MMQITSYCYCSVDTGNLIEVLESPLQLLQVLVACSFFPSFFFENFRALLVTLTRKQWKERDMTDLHILQGYRGAHMMKSE